MDTVCEVELLSCKTSLYFPVINEKAVSCHKCLSGFMTVVSTVIIPT